MNTKTTPPNTRPTQQTKPPAQALPIRIVLHLSRPINKQQRPHFSQKALSKQKKRKPVLHKRMLSSTSLSAKSSQWLLPRCMGVSHGLWKMMHHIICEWSGITCTSNGNVSQIELRNNNVVCSADGADGLWIDQIGCVGRIGEARCHHWLQIVGWRKTRCRSAVQIVHEQYQRPILSSVGTSQLHCSLWDQMYPGIGIDCSIRGSQFWDWAQHGTFPSIPSSWIQLWWNVPMRRSWLRTWVGSRIQSEVGRCFFSACSNIYLSVILIKLRMEVGLRSPCSIEAANNFLARFWPFWLFLEF